MTRSRLDGIRLEFFRLFACSLFTRNTHFARALVTTICVRSKSFLARPKKRQDKVDATSPVRTIHATRARRRREGRGGRKKSNNPRRTMASPVARAPSLGARSLGSRRVDRSSRLRRPPRRRSRTIFLPSTLPGRRGRGRKVVFVGGTGRVGGSAAAALLRQEPGVALSSPAGPSHRSQPRWSATPRSDRARARSPRALLRPGVAESGHRGRRPRGALRRSFPGRRRQRRGARRRHRHGRSLPGRVRRRGIHERADPIRSPNPKACRA